MLERESARQPSEEMRNLSNVRQAWSALISAAIMWLEPDENVGKDNKVGGRYLGGQKT